MNAPSVPTIYCFLNGGSPGWYNVLAIAEDGSALAGHVCSSPAFFLHDIGIESDWKHEHYRAHYPDGYRLEWVERDEIDGHEALQRAFALADEKAATGAVGTIVATDDEEE